MKVLKVLGIVMATLLIVTGCSVGESSGPSDSGKKSDQVFADPNSTLTDTVEKAVGSMDGKRVAFVPLLLKGYGLTSNWFESMKIALEPMGAEVTAYDANFDPQKMVSTIDQIIRDKSADVLVLHNIDVGILVNQIAAAEKAGIYVISVNMLSNRLGDAYVGPNTGLAASDIADRAIADCKAKGKKNISIIDGPGNDGASIEWVTNIERQVKEAGLTVTEVAHSNYDNATAREIAATTLQKQKSDLCAFMVLFDLNSLAVGDAVQEAVGNGLVKNGDVGVYTFSADAAVCDAMDQGLVTASAAYDVTGMGAAVTATIQQLIQMNQPPGSFHTVSFLGHRVVDKTDMHNYNVACWVNQ
jgi:ribose transport system substrate-binding protein